MATRSSHTGIKFFFGSCIGILFVLFSLMGDALLDNRRINRSLQEISHQNTQLSLENLRLQSELKYLSSEQYREKWHKQHLNIASESEVLYRVVVVADDDTSILRELSAQELNAYALQRSAPLRHWRELFFGEEILWNSSSGQLGIEE